MPSWLKAWPIFISFYEESGKRAAYGFCSLDQELSELEDALKQNTRIFLYFIKNKSVLKLSLQMCV